MRAKKAIYGFAEAARLFWLALVEALQMDGWAQSVLEPALFYLRSQTNKLQGILCTHVDDFLAGVHPRSVNDAFRRTKQKLSFSKRSQDEFVFRGREIARSTNGDIQVTMKNYALSLTSIKIPRERHKQPESALDDNEVAT